ncbi:MAG: TIGR00730 family Rossman fold protein, partial [Acidimicrobiales bacterium]
MSRRVKTGSADIDRRIEELLGACGVTEDRDLLFDIIASGVLLARGDSDRLDLKLTAAVLAEMRVAFNAFAPYRDEPKVTIFGSARILADDPLYQAARDVARQLAQQGWMVITGAGPGIMAAGLEGAGREKSFGVNIRLPFEQEANEFILGDTKLISMKYFFTRKLELVKESQGFICLPGGFGTLDETFELLTLQQTGKSVPTPIVFLDEPGGSYWTGWRDFVLDQVVAGGYVAAEDLALVTITDDEQVAVDTVLGFYRNYRSIRWVGKTLVVRLVKAPTDDELAA